MIGWSEGAIYLGQGLAAWLACRVARRRPSHRAFAVYLVLLALSDPLRGLFHEAVLDPVRKALGPAVPFSGAVRALWHVDQALFLALPVGMTLAGLRLFAGVSLPWAQIAGAASAAETLFVCAYPSLRGQPLGRVYLGIHLAAQLAVWGSIGRWLCQRAQWPLPTQTLFVVYAGADLALLLLPKSWENLFQAWPLASGSYLALQVVSCVVQAAWLRAVTVGDQPDRVTPDRPTSARATAPTDPTDRPSSR